MFTLSTARIALLSASFGLGMTCISHAQTAQVQPQQIATQADADYNAATARVEQARAQVDAANTIVSEISSQLGIAQLRAAIVRQRIVGGQQAIAKLEKMVDDGAAQPNASRQTPAAGAAPDPLRDAYESAKLEAIKEFNASPEYRWAVDEINTLGANLRTVQAQSIQQFSASAEYRKAAEDAKTADAALASAKEKFASNLPQATSATQAAADAHAKLDALVAHRLEIDPNAQIVQARLSSAKNAMRRHFMDDQLLKNPKVVAADQALKARAAQAEPASADLVNAAQQQLADVKGALKGQIDALAADQIALDETTAEISRLQAELPGAQADAYQANGDLERFTAYASASRQSRDNTYATLQASTAQPATVYPTSPYAYNPPSVIYGAPLYVGVPYVRPYVVAPTRYGYVPHVYAAHAYHHAGHR